jgi:hypothetical protein
MEAPTWPANSSTQEPLQSSDDQLSFSFRLNKLKSTKILTKTRPIPPAVIHFSLQQTKILTKTRPIPPALVHFVLQHNFLPSLQIHSHFVRIRKQTRQNVSPPPVAEVDIKEFTQNLIRIYDSEFRIPSIRNPCSLLRNSSTNYSYRTHSKFIPQCPLRDQFHQPSFSIGIFSFLVIVMALGTFNIFEFWEPLIMNLG